MGDRTGIEWTDATWNPVTGCTKVSQGCKNCYAERVFPRAYGGMRIPIYHEGELLSMRPREFTDVQCHPERLDQPLRWKKPRRIFVNSMSDLFHESVPDEFIDQVFHVMGACEWIKTGHVFQVLTKRPERMLKYMLERGHRAWNGKRPGGEVLYPPSNIHVGVSCEDQPTADERTPLLLQTPAALRFVSLEPLLGAIDIEQFLPVKCGCRSVAECFHNMTLCVDWVIVGGESGAKARPMHPDWARSLRDQCVTAGVPFFFKQWGEWATTYDRDRDDPDWMTCTRAASSTPRGRWLNLVGGHGFHGDRVVRVVPVGKKAAGATLDGREWREYP
ncbi:MAG TPA: phage Gp37/Gp68 family protein [Candidatus Saccharimonadales bacterium]|nr:phage Gp37/Gp68 family protein [Candidatus Saccharimonadales bacterium]